MNQKNIILRLDGSKAEQQIYRCAAGHIHARLSHDTYIFFDGHAREPVGPNEVTINNRLHVSELGTTVILAGKTLIVAAGGGFVRLGIDNATYSVLSHDFEAILPEIIETANNSGDCS